MSDDVYLDRCVRCGAPMRCSASAGEAYRDILGWAELLEAEPNAVPAARATTARIALHCRAALERPGAGQRPRSTTPVAGTIPECELAPEPELRCAICERPESACVESFRARRKSVGGVGASGGQLTPPSTLMGASKGHGPICFECFDAWYDGGLVHADAIKAAVLAKLAKAKAAQP